MSYAIFRVQGIKTTGDLRGIGKHNVDRKSETNMDIDASRTADNIHLISADNKSDSYLKKFFRTVEPMKEQHEEKMKTERKDRVKSFEAKINSTKNDIACEFLFTSDEKFFKDKSRGEIQEWANESLDFVKNEIGIGEENILHAVVHMDEKTPHLHIVAVPLVNKYDGRSKKEVWQISRKHFIPGKEDLSVLQDKYFEKMKGKGYDLERGVAARETERKHLTTQEFKKQEIGKEVETLEKDRQKLQEDVQELSKAVQGTKALDSIEVETVGLFKRNMVKMSIEDFESIKTLATGSEGLKKEITSLKLDKGLLGMQVHELKAEKEALKTENAELKNENENLETKNKELEAEVSKLQLAFKHLQQTLVIMKKNVENQLGIGKEKFKEFVGASRLHELTKRFGKEKSFMPEVRKTMIPEDEIKGAEKYMDKINKKEMEEEQEKALQEKVSKEQNREEPDLGR